MTPDAVTEDRIQGSHNGSGETGEEITATVQERNNRILNPISGIGDGINRGGFKKYLGIQRSGCTVGGYDIREETGREGKWILTSGFQLGLISRTME